MILNSRRILWLLLTVGLMLLFSNCCSQPIQEVIYKDRVITVVPPVIHDTLHTFIQDTIITGQKIREITDSLTGQTRKDTVIKFKYYPRQQYADIEVKPDPMKIYLHDTITVNKTVLYHEKYGILKLLGAGFAGIIIGLVIGFAKRI